MGKSGAERCYLTQVSWLSVTLCFLLADTDSYAFSCGLCVTPHVYIHVSILLFHWSLEPCGFCLNAQLMSHQWPTCCKVNSTGSLDRFTTPMFHPLGWLWCVIRSFLKLWNKKDLLFISVHVLQSFTTNKKSCWQRESARSCCLILSEQTMSLNSNFAALPNCTSLGITKNQLSLTLAFFWESNSFPLLGKTAGGITSPLTAIKQGK